MKKGVTFRSSARRAGPSPWRARLLALAFTLFVAGGLYFGFIFVSTAIDLIEMQTGIDLPNPPGVVAGNKPPATNNQNVTAPPKAGERINILLLGLDQRPIASSDPSRSDVMMVASLEPRSQTAALLSIPRDLWVAIPDPDGEVIYNKINTAHFFGQYWNQLDGIEADGGPELAKRVVEYNLGIPIHYYARIDFKGFEKAIDLVGGIDVDVPYEIYDDEYPLENDTGITTVYFPAGPQHLNGEEALRYARTRNVDSDFGRMGRQRQVMMALRDQALRLDLIPKLPELIGVMRDSFDTDIPFDQMLSLANVARGIDTDKIVTAAIGPDMVIPDEPIDGALLPKQAEIQQLLNEIFFDPSLAEEKATIEVQNGTLTDGLAGVTAERLRTLGFEIANVRQADESDYEETVIYDYGNKDYTARRLATALRVPQSRVKQASRPSGTTADVVVILGQDAVGVAY